MKFLEGDVVRRKIGGPLMTVEDIRCDGLIATVWFENDQVRRDAFAQNTLEKWQRVDD